MHSKILVTGATGFTGGHLCRRLTAEGREVRALVRSRERGGDLSELGVELAVGDLRDEAAVGEATRGVDAVYHIAALYREERVDRRDFWEVNAAGTRNLLEAALREDVSRFVHCSTVGVHGEIEDPPADEQYGYGPEDHYQESKVAGERAALEYLSTTELPVTVFRPTAIYGPGDKRFLKLFRAIKRGRFAIVGDGQTLYHLVYIDDLVDGILLCGRREEAEGEIYILGGDRPVTIDEFCREIASCVAGSVPAWRVPVPPVYAAATVCEAICRTLGIEPPLYRRRLDFFVKDRAFTITKARRELGYEPEVDLETGVRRTAEWYRREGLL